MFINQPNGGLMYIPDPNTGHSGTWTVTDTKIVIALTIIFFIISLLSIIIEWQFAKRKTTFKEYITEVLQCGLSLSWKYEPTMFTSLMTLLFYIMFALDVIGFGIYFIMGII